jgi:uncharacterized membrane protein YozB (DUF420 family)
MEMTVFWDIASCSFVEVNLCFIGAYCLYHQGDTTRRYMPEGCYLHTFLAILRRPILLALVFIIVGSNNVT